MFAADNMNKAECFRRRYMRTVALQALLVTVAAHLVLLMLFRTVPQKSSDAPDGRSGIRLFNIGANSPERRVRIARWLEVHDPGVIARADSRHSAVMRLVSGKRPDMPDVDAAARHPVPEQRLAAEPGRMNVNPSGSFLPVTAGISAKSSQAALAGYPRIRANAVALTLPVTDEMKKLSREVNAGKTVIELDIGGERDRFFIRKSSGSSRLDMQIVRMLLRNREQLGAGMQEIAVIWQERQSK